jgi:hypothetical protein
MSVACNSFSLNRDYSGFPNGVCEICGIFCARRGAHFSWQRVAGDLHLMREADIAVATENEGEAL